jgi:hypothetical protein
MMPGAFLTFFDGCSLVSELLAAASADRRQPQLLKAKSMEWFGWALEIGHWTWTCED